jgi:hypothetical protein
MDQLFLAKSTLVVVDSNLKLGDYLAYTVLLDILRKNNQKLEVIQPKDFSPSLTGIVQPPEVKQIKQLAPKRYVLSFDKGSDQVKNIQWHQAGEKINIYVSMENGQFSASGMKLQPEGSDYDTILYFGVKDYQQVQPLFSNFPAVVSQAKNISFGWTFAIPHGKVELIRGENNETTAELVYQYGQGKGMTPEHYSRLLASVFAATDRFNSQTTRAKTFTLCADLITNGANLQRANTLVDRTASQDKSGQKPAGGQPATTSPANEASDSTVQDRPNKQDKPATAAPMASTVAGNDPLPPKTNNQPTRPNA